MNRFVKYSSGYLAYFICVAAGDAGLASWHARVAPTTNQLQGVAYGNGQYVAVGKLNTVLTSSDGSNWTLSVAGSPAFADPPFDLFSATAGEGWFVAGGREGWLIRGSRDGIHWTDGIGTIGLENLFGFAYGNDRFVGVGSGSCGGSGYNCGWIVMAADPREFALLNRLAPVTNALLAVTYASNLFIAVGDRGMILTSPDGATWAVRNSGTQVALRAVAFHRSRFIAAGDDGIVVASPDGLSWSGAAPISFDVYGLASGPEGIVAVGCFGPTGRLHVSSDGLLWPGTSLVFSQPLNAVVHGPGSFIAAGDGGLIIQSDDLANYWTKSTSGYWEEPYWSLGELPSIQQPAIVLMSPGWKALAVGPTTTANYSNALTIESLIIAAPDNAFNQLLLNYAGLNVPLNIASDFSLGPNASLVSDYSRLNARRLLLSGSATFSSQSVASLSNIVVGDAAPGELNIGDAAIHAGALMVGSGAPGTVNQSGGTNQVDAKLSISGQSIYHLTNGFLEAGTLFLGEESRPGWTGRFYAWGGSTILTGSLRMGTSPELAADARGELALIGGSFQTPVIEFGNGIFTQIGGTNLVQTLNMPAPGAFGWANYGLAGGTLVSESLVVGANPLGYFVQSGGVHTNTQSITIYGQSIPEHSPWGTYLLLGGWLSSPQLQVLGGAFTQENGTNEAIQLSLDMTTTFTLSGGLLTSSNISIRSTSARNRQMLSSFVHSNGTHIIRNRLYVLDGVYRMEAGTLAASSLHLGPDGELRLKGGSVDVSDSFSMDHGTCLVQGQNYRLGKLLVLSTGALSRFPDGPQVCSFDLQTGPTVLRFLDSHDLASDWSGTLAIKNWNGSTNGGGTHQILVGTAAQGLTPAQLGRIVFLNPKGLPAANYPARILGTGEIVPGPRPAINLARFPGILVLSWTGDYQLLNASKVTGPYTPVVGAESPHTNLLSGPEGFFQLRSR